MLDRHRRAELEPGGRPTHDVRAYVRTRVVDGRGPRWDVSRQSRARLADPKGPHSLTVRALRTSASRDGILPSWGSCRRTHRSRGVAPATLYGLLARGAAEALEATYEFAWQKDRALVEVIDGALAAAADGNRAGDAAKPRWLDGLVDRELRAASTTYWSQERFARVRLLERLGLVELEADDTYVLAMVSALGPDKADRLRADPDLVDRAVWRLFEVEGGGEVSLTNVDRFGGDEWRRDVPRADLRRHPRPRTRPDRMPDGAGQGLRRLPRELVLGHLPGTRARRPRRPQARRPSCADCSAPASRPPSPSP